MAGGLGLGGFGRRRGSQLNADINVTSLVDVAFVLLIIFMITAPIMQGGVDVELPRAAAKPISAKQGVVVTVDRQGRIFVDETQFTYEQFKASFKALVARRNATSVYIRGDRRVGYGNVVRVLAIVRESGVENVGLTTEDEEVPQ